MIKSLELGEAHPLLPASYVGFVRKLWHAQESKSQHTWSRESVLARQSVFSNLLASERLGTELRRVYETPVGPKIAIALTRQAVHIPELWDSEDKRTKNEQLTQFRQLKSDLIKTLAVLDQDRAMSNRTDTTEIKQRRAKRSASKLEAKTYRPMRLAFDDLVSGPLVVGRGRGRAIRVSLSIYDLNRILRAFQRSIDAKIENINKFRKHAADDPVLRHMGQMTKGTPSIRYAALLLDQSIDRFSGHFTRRNLSRDKLVSAFVMAIYPNTKEEVGSYKAINRICLQRRK